MLSGSIVNDIDIFQSSLLTAMILYRNIYSLWYFYVVFVSSTFSKSLRNFLGSHQCHLLIGTVYFFLFFTVYLLVFVLASLYFLDLHISIWFERVYLRLDILAFSLSWRNIIHSFSIKDDISLRVIFFEIRIKDQKTYGSPGQNRSRCSKYSK